MNENDPKESVYRSRTHLGSTLPFEQRVLVIHQEEIRRLRARVARQNFDTANRSRTNAADHRARRAQELAKQGLVPKEIRAKVMGPKGKPPSLSTVSRWLRRDT